MMDKLIAELEQATEGSRELDRHIYKVAFRDKQSPFEERRLTTDMEYVPSYTNSLDAALTLVPEGAVWHVMTDYGGLNRAKVGPEGRPSASIYDINVKDWDPPVFKQADAATPVLALCIAALKARQA